jgi:hypothetical protein
MPFDFTLHIKFIYIALKTNDFNFPMIQTDIKIIHIRQILISLFLLELSMECVETRTKPIWNILAKNKMDTANDAGHWSRFKTIPFTFIYVVKCDYTNIQFVFYIFKYAQS